MGPAAGVAGSAYTAGTAWPNTVNGPLTTFRNAVDGPFTTL